MSYNASISGDQNRIATPIHKKQKSLSAAPLENTLPHPVRPPPPLATRPTPPTHKRTYQACIPCRQRKVRCDLGSVESPHEPPCVRCRRESKECFFSATRRKRTPSGEIPAGLGRGRGIARKRDDVDVDGGPLKRARSGEVDESMPFSPPNYAQSQMSPSFTDPLIDPALRRESNPPPPMPPQPSNNDTTTTTDTILHSEMYNSHEALLTLIEAAGKDTPMDRKPERHELESDGEEGDADSMRDEHSNTTSSTRSRRAQSPQTPSVRWSQSTVIRDGARQSKARKGSTGIFPRTTFGPRISTEDDGMDKALRSWDKFRFVRAGWFTAREAIDLVEHYFHKLHPLSPTLTNPTLTHVSHPRYHHLLLRHEPFLATAILCVATRYMDLPGPGGRSRSFAIHDTLWREIRNAFERIMWGGGWGGLGIPKPIGIANGMTVDPANGASTGRGLRTLGTVEALMILTEWHVRGIHFPMDVEESDWGIEISEDEESPKPRSPRQKRQVMVEGLGDRLANILEPAYRSDRMCWMLLGNALSLAYELGVFDETGEDTTPAPTPPATVEPAMPFRTRCKRIQRLLMVYNMQLASRLGWTSMIPRGIRDIIKRNKVVPGPTNDWSDPDALQDAVFSCWVDLTVFMTSSADILFPSRSATRQLMRSGRYVDLLEHFQAPLKTWKQEFLALNLPAPIHHILVLEYEHVRFYINSLALQAVVDRYSQSSAPSVALTEISKHDLDFIREVVDAARSLLSTVVTHMFPSGYLKHAPARVYFRILSASMFLLKTFTLGAKEVEVKESMTLLESVCECLRSAAVDDLHLGLRFADILRGLADRVRHRFVRMHAQRSAPNTPALIATEEPDEPQQQEQPQLLRAFTPGLGSYSEPPHVPPEGITAHAQQEEMSGDVGYGDAAGMWWGGNENWLALPLDPIMGFDGVTNGTMGVDVGGMDLLEVLLAGEGSGGIST